MVSWWCCVRHFFFPSAILGSTKQNIYDAFLETGQHHPKCKEQAFQVSWKTDSSEMSGTRTHSSRSFYRARAVAQYCTQVCMRTAGEDVTSASSFFIGPSSFFHFYSTAASIVQ